MAEFYLAVTLDDAWLYFFHFCALRNLSVSDLHDGQWAVLWAAVPVV